MKRSAVVCAVCACMFLLPAAAVSAEDTAEPETVLHNNLYAGWGTQSFSSGLLTVLSSMFSSIGTSGKSSWTNRPLGVFQAGYDYAVTEHWLVGAFATYEYTFCNDQNSSAAQSVFMESLQAKATFIWGWKHVKLYHAVSAGCAWYQDQSIPSGGAETDSNNQCMFAFNITPVGVRIIPAEHFYLFADCSVPSTGFFNTGAGIQF
jgi:hypothetical protein